MTPVVRVGVGVFVTHKLFPNSILLGTRMGSHGAGRLSCPGGHLELGESWEDCAIREVKEETNLDLINVQFCNVTNDANIDNNPEKHYITIFMKSEVKLIPDNSNQLVEQSPLINMEPHKNLEWNWVPWEEVIKIKNETPERLFDPLLHLIEKLPTGPF